LALAPGTRLGVYEVTAPIGEGGMGQVYRAHDTKLNRDVALKLLPDAFAGDPDRLARFTREAQTLASLNHPHIAAIYGIEESDGIRALVMELVEGEDLSQHIARGAIPLAEALPIATQITEALEAAHEQGIIHRDLKPANVKVRGDGTVKVLDFGLAKALEPTGAASSNVSQSPTITTPAMTQAGMILGTAAYMSPEQAKGRAADKRSDVWAFGVVLYEMLTGQRAFKGEDVSDTLAFILTREPDWAMLPADTPPLIRRLLRRCLQKDRRRRLADAADARLEIEEASTVPAAADGAATPLEAAPRPLWRSAVPVVITAVVVFALTAGAMWRLRPSVPAPVTRFAIALPDGQQLTPIGRGIAMSPAGTHIVYIANRRLYLRSLSDLEVRPITGVDNAGGTPGNPVFSPDGRSIAYAEGGTIKRIALSGGAAVTVCEADTPAGMSWNGDTIFFGQGSKGIMRVSANGGKPETVASVKTGELAHGPQLLPDGQTLLFTLATGTNKDRWDKARIVAESLTSHERKTLIDGGSDARYLPTGHLVYALSGVVFALPFDVKRITSSGGAVPIVEGVRRASAAANTGSAQFGISDTGSLVYIPGPVSTASGQVSVGLFDRKGGSELLKIQPGAYQLPRMSPDGKRVAFGSDDGKEASIWIYELSGTSSAQRLTFEGQGHNRFPAWSADGQRVAFQSDREGDLGIFWQRADGTGTAERLTKADEGVSHIPESWNRDGEHLLYNAGKAGANSLWVFSLKDRTAARFDEVESLARTLTGAVFSPDGRWVAYASQQGRPLSAVYVQPFPPTGATKYQISKNADDGHHPMWSPDGAELLFTRSLGAPMAAVRITTQPSFAVGEAMPVSRPFQTAAPFSERPYDISRDGQHFLGLIDAAQTQSGAPAAQQIQVVLNWFTELQQRVPTR
jgi:Tol biopolymer transport system component